MKPQCELTDEERSHLEKLERDYKRIAIGHFVKRGGCYSLRGEVHQIDFEEAWQRVLVGIVDDMLRGTWSLDLNHHALCRRVTARYHWAVKSFRLDWAMGIGNLVRGVADVQSLDAPVGDSDRCVKDVLEVLQGQVTMAGSTYIIEDVRESIASLPEWSRTVMTSFVELVEDGSIAWREKGSSWTQLLADKLTAESGRKASRNSARVGLHKARNLLWSELVRRAVFEGSRPELVASSSPGKKKERIGELV